MVSNDEIRWWRRFRKCMADMPNTMEILVSAHGQISAAERGASLQYFNTHGDVDNVPLKNLPSFKPEGVENNGSSL